MNGDPFFNLKPSRETKWIIDFLEECRTFHDGEIPWHQLEMIRKLSTEGDRQVVLFHRGHKTGRQIFGTTLAMATAALDIPASLDFPIARAPEPIELTFSKPTYSPHDFETYEPPRSKYIPGKGNQPWKRRR